MLGATVPEAPIDEDGDPQPREGHVRHAARLLQDLIVDPVAQASSVKLSSQCDFGISSLLPNLRHAATDLGRRGLNARHRQALVSSSSGRDRREMGVDAARDGTTEINGNRVADEPPENLEAHFAVIRHESVVKWEAL